MKKARRSYPYIQEKLLNWFDHNRRDLPWRRTYSPYEIWISEIMLQQTQVKTMIPYFFRWMERFPDLPAVAEARDEDLLKAWEGLGYYSRVRNLHRTAQIVMNDFGGAFPQEYRTVLSLPGIGRYTAGAILSVAFNQDYPVVDGNVERIFSRLFNITTPVKESKAQTLIWKTAGELLPIGEARRFNQGLMDLGALVCLPRKTDCAQCPVHAVCDSFRSGVVNERPVRGVRKRITPIEVAVGVLVHQGKVFIQKRPATGLMANLWEFPGGKLEEGETPEEALIREFDEELQIKVRSTEKIALIRHGYTSFKVTLHAYLCTLEDPKRQPVLRSAVEARWVAPDQLERFVFPAANRKLIATLLKRHLQDVGEGMAAA